ncbi:MAG: DNA cytosine methyltransferase [Deltaproteobacteria bacterium]|nr:DNA cytosine methyltransferase [Deltaproteobacteria bacterium]
MRIPTVDLFAGPGGLGEGFATYRGLPGFDVVLSIEKDPIACRTLELRNFFRQFGETGVPELYFAYVIGGEVTREELFRAFPAKARRTSLAVWQAELGREPLQNVLRRIRKAVGASRYWVLLGGPPCQAYSFMGRARMKGMEGFEKDERHTLYLEYLKIVAALKPTVFVMENVKGILSSRHQDEKIFARILRDMRDPWNALAEEDRRKIQKPPVPHRYRLWSFSKTALRDDLLGPNDFVIEAENFGVPQTRHRVIILGIREDYNIIPPVLEKVAGKITVREVIEGLPMIRSRLSGGKEDSSAWTRSIREGIDDHIRDSAPDVASEIRRVLRELPESLDTGGRFISGGIPPRRLTGWLYDSRLNGVLQHEARAHMSSDLHRYLYAACYAEVRKRFPRIEEFPESLWPMHKNVRKAIKIGDFRDRFRVQLWDEVAATITSHICKDGHYYIHPDPSQCRSLTVREAARLQTFPDNYFFEGSRTDQYRQVGNAVPPFLAFQLADVVAEVLAECIEQDIGRSSTANVIRTAV